MGGGAGSGGGGGSSGTVDYPQYMKDMHSQLHWNMNTAVIKAQAGNPYDYIQAWSPTSMITQMTATVDCFDELIRDFNPLDLWSTLIGEVPNAVLGLVKDDALDEFITSQQKKLCKITEEEVIPKYRRGMQDIGAVMTSAFKIGESLLWAKVIEEEANLEKEYKGKLMMAAYDYAFRSINDIIQMTMQKISYHKDITHYALEVLRMGYTAMKEYTDTKNVYEIEKTKWNLEMYKYLMDSLGSIASSAGTSYTTSSSGTSRISSAIGGALSGAAGGLAVGAAMGSSGGPIGAAIGGAVGLVGGLFG